MQSVYPPPRLASSIPAVPFEFWSIKKIVWVFAFTLSGEYRWLDSYSNICQQDSNNENVG